jgi:hypothetical protein
MLPLQGADPWAVDKLGSTALHYGAGEAATVTIIAAAG